MIYTDFTRWPIPMMSFPDFLLLLTNSIGVIPLSHPSENCLAEASNAPPKRSPYIDNTRHIWETGKIKRLDAPLTMNRRVLTLYWGSSSRRCTFTHWIIWIFFPSACIDVSSKQKHLSPFSTGTCSLQDLF
jgi:hypothetical protein